jgi:hypothetical protein
MTKNVKETKGVTIEQLMQQLEEQKKMIETLSSEKEMAILKAVEDTKKELLNDKSLFSDLLSKKQEKEKAEKEKNARDIENAELWRINSTINLLKNTISSFFEDLPKSVVIKTAGKIITIKNTRSAFPDTIISPINGSSNIAKTTTTKEIKTLTDGTPYKNCLEILGKIAKEKEITLTTGQKTYPNEAKKKLIAMGLLSA